MHVVDPRAGGAGAPRVTVVVMVKAPVPGRAKTRLCPPATPGQAADLAAAGLLDTLATAGAVPGGRVVVALTGDLAGVARAAEVRAALDAAAVVPQRGEDLGARIAAAHVDAAAARPGVPTLQIGTDVPQLTAPLLAEAADRLTRADAVFGPAADGGWWGMGLRDPRAGALVAGVPTSRADTGERTLAALRAGGLRVELLPVLRDVDTMTDALAVAALVPHTRFAAAVGALGHR